MSTKPVQRPATLRYRDLIEALDFADQELADNPSQPLVASIRALQGVIQFIRADPTLGPAGTGVALRRLFRDLCDAANGAKPPMLFDNAVNKVGKSGRPTNQTFDTLRGHIAGAANVLIEAGMKNAEAGRYLENKLAEAGVRLKGKRIEGKQILQWREQTGDTAPKASDEAFKQFSALAQSLPSSGRLDGAKAIANISVKVAVMWNSN